MGFFSHAFPRSIVEVGGDQIAFALGDSNPALTFGRILPDQSVGVHCLFRAPSCDAGREVEFGKIPADGVKLVSGLTLSSRGKRMRPPRGLRAICTRRISVALNLCPVALAGMLTHVVGLRTRMRRNLPGHLNPTRN